MADLTLATPVPWMVKAELSLPVLLNLAPTAKAGTVMLKSLVDPLGYEYVPFQLLDRGEAGPRRTFQVPTRLRPSAGESYHLPLMVLPSAERVPW